MFRTSLDKTVSVRRVKSGVGFDKGFGGPSSQAVLGDSISDDPCSARRQTCSHRINSVLRVFVVVLMFSSFAAMPKHAHAQGTFSGDNQACSVDQPCFNGAHQEGNTVVFQFTATGPWDYYNVRYPQAGGGEKQVENKTGSFTFTNVQPNSVYRISVQGCNSHTLAHSTCTDWSQSSVTTAPAEKTGSVSTPVVRAPPPPPVYRGEPVKSIGRVNRGSVLPSPSSGPVPICDSARSARARNSPAAPSLEAQCRAQGGDPSGAQTEPLRASVPMNVGPLTPSQLELEDEGSRTVSADKLLSAMRDLEPEGPRRLGFEIGVATGDGQTLWGPGKQAMIDSLPEAVKSSAERSAHFVVARNANAQFDSAGVTVAESETRSDLIAARFAESPGYYTLGFDIGAGIFASAPRGGAGHTLPGPGSIGIRNSLPPPGVRGFDAAMTLYIGK